VRKYQFFRLLTSRKFKTLRKLCNKCFVAKNYRPAAAGIAAVATAGQPLTAGGKKERPQEAPFLPRMMRPDKVPTSGKPVAAQINFNVNILK
jgi:hypothetical protein